MRKVLASEVSPYRGREVPSTPGLCIFGRNHPDSIDSSLSMSEMPKAYEPQQYEDNLYKRWEEAGVFNPDNLSGDPYSIMMPPPNVTGVLHLGHALENALMDAMARYQRLQGKKVLLVPGTDHAAIATQAKVEKLLMQQGVKDPRRELGRDGLVEKIREFAEGSKATILSQVKKMGTSADWSRLAYTFDDERNAVVKELFSRMYKDGLIYRGYRVVNWSVKGQSTCSDDEIVYVERPAKLYTFKYSKDFPITIATTRPETKLGDTADAVHPSDERYQQYIGQTFTVDVGATESLQIKVIADEAVDPVFGTGALGVTPAHSTVDFVMYEKQKAKGDLIGLIPVIGPDGRMTKEAGRTYEGMTSEAARAAFVLWLNEQGLLEKTEDIVQSVGTADRYGDVIEALPMTQWWLDVTRDIPGRGKSLRQLMREAVTTGLNGDEAKKVTITPDRFTKLYLDRVDNLRDWCLSRQLWWGHRIPVWYRGEEIHVSAEAPKGEGWEQDPDTLDTWFSSGSWTFSTLGWPEKTKDLETFYPTQWIQMGYEILYLWLMRMILMSAYALEDVPFKNAYIHGMLRDQHGQKFSKSAGNGIDPLEIIATYGCDALRLSLLTGIAPGNDSRFYTEKVEGSRNLVNKLWNISRYVFSTTEGARHVDSLTPRTLADRWILSRFSETVKKVSDMLERQDFSLATEVLREFTWTEFADWYLEIAKVEKDKDEILLFILERLLVLWHPFTPFVTEEIYSQFDRGLVAVAKWPSDVAFTLTDEERSQFMKLKEIVTTARDARAGYQLPTIDALILDGDFLKEHQEVLATLAKISSLRFGASEDRVQSVASAAISFVLPEGFDMAGLRAKREKERISVESFIAGLEKKLENSDFVKNAPAAVIAQEQKKLTDAKEKLAAITRELESLS